MSPNLINRINITIRVVKKQILQMLGNRPIGAKSVYLVTLSMVNTPFIYNSHMHKKYALTESS